MKRSLPLILVAASLAAASCSDEPTRPDAGGDIPSGVDLGLTPGTLGDHQAQGEPSSDNPLAGEFAVALTDSLGGFVVISYDESTSDLFILQLQEARTGTFACGPVEDGPQCHARYLENVREEDGEVLTDGRLDLTSGTLVITTAGPSEVEGTFDARLERAAGDGEDVIEVDAGAISVPLLPEASVSGGLTCLIGLTGASATCGT